MAKFVCGMCWEPFEDSAQCWEHVAKCDNFISFDDMVKEPVNA